jgi:parallel beta-helix repeat protein
MALLLASLATPALAAPDYPGGPDLIVDDDLACSGATFHTIQAALDAAAPGSKVRVCPGSYTEDLRIRTPLKLVAKPLGQATIHGSIVVLQANGVRIEGLVVDASGRTVGITIEGETSGFDIRNTRVSYASSAGIEIFEASDGIVRENVLVDNIGIGLRLLEAFRTEVKQNTVMGNGSDGIVIFEGAANHLDTNTSSSNGGNGIHVCFDTSRNLIEKTTARGNAGAGIAVCSDGATTTQLRKNTLLENGIDALDASIGAGTAGTSSIWTKNTCITSAPAGLCRK